MISLALGLTVLFFVTLVQAHPLGNSTVNRQGELRVSANRIQIRYLLDMAEIPTLLAAQQADLDGDGLVSSTEWDRFTNRYAGLILEGITLSVNGRDTKPVPGKTRWFLVPGTAGLLTLLQPRKSALLRLMFPMTMQ